jgi:hypothetical protein
MLNAQLKVAVSAEYTNPVDLGEAKYPLEYAASVVLADGSGANQANKLWTDTRTLTASSTENLDLNAVLTDIFGAALAFTKIKALVIKAADTNVNDVVVGGAGANAAASFFADATDKVRVKPGGTVALIAPDANGYAVTAATGDILLVANGAAGTSVTYTIIVIGA